MAVPAQPSWFHAFAHVLHLRGCTRDGRFAQHTWSLMDAAPARVERAQGTTPLDAAA
jgi:hypothetical protein